MEDDWERPIEEQDDFAATLTPELRAQEEYLRAQIAAGAPMSFRPSESQYDLDPRRTDAETDLRDDRVT